MEPLFTFVTLDHVIIHLRHVAVTVQLYLYICELAWVLAIIDIGKDVVFKSFFLLCLFYDTLIRTSALFTRFIDKL